MLHFISVLLLSFSLSYSSTKYVAFFGFFSLLLLFPLHLFFSHTGVSARLSPISLSLSTSFSWLYPPSFLSSFFDFYTFMCLLSWELHIKCIYNGGGVWWWWYKILYRFFVDAMWCDDVLLLMMMVLYKLLYLWRWWW